MRPGRLPFVFVLVFLFGASLSVTPALAQTFCDFAPRVSTSGARGAIGVPVVVEVTASDPNGDAVTSLTADASGLPAGNNASFTTTADNTSGTLTWTPQAGQTGNFTVVFTATANALSTSISAGISVTDTAGRPFVQCPVTLSAPELGRFTFKVYAGDPDGEAIASLTVAPLPGTATFTTNASNTAGTFDWQTDFTSAGTYTITFTASNSQVGSSSTSLTVTNSDRAPIVNAPPSATGTEGSLLQMCVSASDPDGDAITSLTAAPLPSGATFNASPSHEVGTFSWTPASGQAGMYNVTFTASNALSGSRTVPITIQSSGGDRAPVVTAPGSASARVGTPFSLTVTASDPDGDAITSLTASPLISGMSFLPNFDNTEGTLSWTPVAGQEGTIFVTFVASNALSGGATTAIVVSANYPTLVFTTGADKTIHLGSGKPLWCVSFEPVGGSYQVTDVIPGSVVLKSTGTGTVSQISASQGKSFIVGDQNNDQVPDLEVCFLKSDLRQLFSNLTGKTTVQVSLEGDLTTGGHFSGVLQVDVVAGGGNHAASITPNPPNPGATVRFATTRAGAVRARVFDIRGRLVRTLAVPAEGGAGEHALRFDGLGDGGRPLPAGVYLFRIETPDGELTAKAAIVH
ncbi:MAG TPA: putative Ig domain-containing protein [Candidatus Limnocylindrales bacterium]|nr:putative Ig domain-containing protein [Candidatus Limnocylindrales bacterium]